MINALYVNGNKSSLPGAKEKGINLDHVQNGMIAISAVQSGDFDAVIIEDELPLMTPSRLIKELFKTNRAIPIVTLVRSEKRRKTILDDVGMGLFGYFEPEFSSVDHLLNLLKSAKRFHEFKKQAPKTSLRHFSGRGFEKIVGYSDKMLDIYHLMTQIKTKDVTTILYGESGTGKNLIADTLHRISLRRDRPNIAVNCPAIPSELLESELFGHEKGAFTGAHERKDGKFLAANSGSIFLDEIGDMSPSLQAKVLRVLESGEIERVGGAETIKINVRIISATNQPLDSKIQDGSFRQDLYHRINVFPITIPPLRDRKEDIAPTVMTILKSLKKKHKISVDFISHNAMNRLIDFDWPGNVREMENTLERVVLINDKSLIKLDNIESILNTSTNFNVGSKEESIEKNINLNAIADGGESNEVEKIKNLPDSALFKIDKPMTLKELEKIAILAGLERANWNMSTASQQLGISRMTLYRKLTQHNISKDG
ncbi:sigma-54 dependent transcriptional regulator [Candidatus Marinimicrobia bacterium]|nr:sigma-54 dependent transcriptional regulator [Candidatus Neomarinimicrobiota bacterium]